MRTGDVILGLAFAAGLVLAYTVGHKQGLKSAPEYVANKEQEAAERAAIWAAMDEAYKGSQDMVCDEIFELVLSYQADNADDLLPDRADGY